MIVPISKMSENVYVGNFNSNFIEIRKTENNKWQIYINRQAHLQPFHTREKAIKNIQNEAEKIVAEKMAQAPRANQRGFSSAVIRQAAPFINRQRVSR